MMFFFHTIRSFKIALLVALVGTIPQWAFGAQSKIENWQFARILNDFRGTPDKRYFLVSSPPEIRQLDTAGGELIFRITPTSYLGCTQTFKIGWIFERDVGYIREGESFSVQLFIEPAGDAGVGLKKCYVQAKQRALTGWFTALSFTPSGGSHFLGQAE